MYKNFTKSRQYSIAEDILNLCITISVLAYLAIGFWANIWHPTWLIFVGGVVLAILSYMVALFSYKKSILGDDIIPFNKQFEATFVYAKTVKISGMLFILTIACYVIVASFTGLWHPLWLLFFVMATIEQTIALIYKVKYKDFKTTACDVVEIENLNSDK